MSFMCVKHFELPCVERCCINKLALPSDMISPPIVPGMPVRRPAAPPPPPDPALRPAPPRPPPATWFPPDSRNLQRRGQRARRYRRRRRKEAKEAGSRREASRDTPLPHREISFFYVSSLFLFWPFIELCETKSSPLLFCVIHLCVKSTQKSI